MQAIGRVSEPLTLETLELNFRDDVLSNMVVMLLRMVTSAEIQRRQEHFAPFIMVGGDGGVVVLVLVLVLVLVVVLVVLVVVVG